ncbi:MAG: PAS domain-containing protein [Desulfobacteraceae bacterium]|nr:PAS domain-containing protein [Desulfobacteraceae bacterium]MBC2718147.1 PAS domain-containing protein [Desulfobacteraceae bacterium]
MAPKLTTKEELLEDNRFLNSVLNGIRDQIMVVDKHYRIEEVNKAFLDRVGKQKKEIIGRHCYHVLHDEDKPCKISKHFCPVQEAFNSGEPYEALHTRYKCRKVSYFRIIAYPMLDENGSVTRVIDMARDITQWKKSGDHLYHVQKLIFLGKLAADLAHEFNNPMGVILGFADLLLEKMEPGSKNYDMLKTIERQGLNCKKIVENLLSFARHPEESDYSADVNASIEKVLLVVENILLNVNITIVKNYTKDLPNVRGDSKHLQQVFINLITNAVSAMQGGGTLTICSRLDTSGSKVEILFKDTGYGIKKEYRDRIFDPFFTTRDVGEGTGLGLSASYGIVSKYDGNITFETATEEEDKDRKGTTFSVVLPVVLFDA